MALFSEVTGIESYTDYIWTPEVRDVTWLYHTEGILLEVKKVVVCTNYTLQLAEQLERAKYFWDARALLPLESVLLKWFETLEHHLWWEKSVLTYIPIGLNRLVQRGFNQWYFLAWLLSRSRKLLRIQNFFILWSSGHQAHKSRKERLKSVFRFYKKFRRVSLTDTPVVIIDDVISTGSTLENYSQALLKQGYTQIYVLVLARRDQE